VPADAAACGMPVSLQVERLKRALAARASDAGSDGTVTVLEAELYALTGADRDAALDALVAGEPSPYVLLAGRLVCAGAVDSAAVLGALR